MVVHGLRSRLVRRRTLLAFASSAPDSLACSRFRLQLILPQANILKLPKRHYVAIAVPSRSRYRLSDCGLALAFIRPFKSLVSDPWNLYVVPPCCFSDSLRWPVASLLRYILNCDNVPGVQVSGL